MHYQLQGAFAYYAKEEIESGRLHIGSIVKLVHEPINQNDSNAIKVILDSNGKKLGYLPREQAAKLFKFVQPYMLSKVVDCGLTKKRNGDSSPYCIIEVNINGINAFSIIDNRVNEFSGIQGVYSIKNIDNQYEYIGSSFDIGLRLSQHLKLLRSNNHHSNKLQKAWNQSLEYRFDCHIIEIVYDKNDLLNKEQYYIDTHDSFKSGYNSSKYADQTKKYRNSNITFTTAKRKVIDLTKFKNEYKTVRHFKFSYIYGIQKEEYEIYDLTKQGKARSSSIKYILNIMHKNDKLIEKYRSKHNT